MTINTIRCKIRKKYVAATPEEEVRQHTLSFLINNKSYPASLISVEGQIKVGNLTKRYDILVYDRQFKPWLLVECKAPNIKITQKVLDQTSRYNLSIGAKYFILTNSHQTYCLAKDISSNSFVLLEDIPDYQ